MSSMAVDKVKHFPPDPRIWKCLSAFKKASVILDNDTQPSVTSADVAAWPNDADRGFPHMVSMMLPTVCW